MIRSIGFALALVAGTASAGEPMDCYNDERDSDTRYSRATPEVLRVTDADMAKLLERIQAHEISAVASAEADVLARLATKTHASD
jgi:hypothetical protein